MHYIASMNKTPKTEQVVFRTTKEVRDFIDHLCDKYDRSVGYVCNDLIGYFIDNPPKSLPVRKKM